MVWWDLDPAGQGHLKVTAATPGQALRQDGLRSSALGGPFPSTGISPAATALRESWLPQGWLGIPAHILGAFCAATRSAGARSLWKRLKLLWL